MTLELHDNEEGNTLSAKVNKIDYDYQAEQWVQDYTTNPEFAEIIRFVLVDGGDMPRATWERGEDNKVRLVSKASRFTGEWRLGLAFPE